MEGCALNALAWVARKPGGVAGCHWSRGDPRLAWPGGFLALVSGIHSCSHRVVGITPDSRPWAGLLPKGSEARPRERPPGTHFTLGKYGQLGHRDTTSWDRPRLVGYFADKRLHVKTVTCGPWNTYVYAMERGES